MKLNRTELTISIVVMISIVVSALVLILNQGFKYTYYHPTAVVVVESENAAAIADEFSLMPGVSTVDRSLGEIRFQNTSISELEGFSRSLLEREDVTGVGLNRTQQVLPLEINARLMSGILGVVLILAFYFYVTFVRKARKSQRREAVLAILLQALGLYAGLFIVAGLLSLVSGWYQLTEVSFTALGVSGLWGIIVMYLGVTRIDSESDKVVVNSLKQTRVLVTQNLYLLFTGWTILLLGLGFGLGVNFLVDGILIGLSLLVVTASLMFIPNFVHILFEMSVQSRKSGKSKSKKNKNSSKTKPKTASKEKPSTKSQAKPKKVSKTTKKKSRRRNRK